MTNTKIRTRFVATGERTVYVGAEYAGTIVREKDGWRWMGNPRKFRTFTEAAQNVGARFLRRQEAARVKAEVKPGDAVTLRDRSTGYETWHRVQSVSASEHAGFWTLFVGGLRVPYRSADFEFVRVETGTGW
jgi:hypothetical protein